MLGFDDTCLLGGCMAELMQNLLIIFGSRILVGNVTESLVPIMTTWGQNILERVDFLAVCGCRKKEKQTKLGEIDEMRNDAKLELVQRATVRRQNNDAIRLKRKDELNKFRAQRSPFRRGSNYAQNTAYETTKVAEQAARRASEVIGAEIEPHFSAMVTSPVASPVSLKKSMGTRRSFLAKHSKQIVEEYATCNTEEEAYRSQYDRHGKGLFEDYAEMMVQFGYASLFATSFPLAPLMALANNYLEIRVDSHKLCSNSRRPDPRSAEDIGTWELVLQVLAYIAVLTNGLLMCFTAHKLSHYLGLDSNFRKLMAFTIIEHLVMTIKIAIHFLIPDTPTEARIQIERQNHLHLKLVDCVRDEEDEFEQSTTAVMFAAENEGEIPPYRIWDFEELSALYNGGAHGLFTDGLSQGSIPKVGVDATTPENAV